jgi:hypothetical protein
MSVIDIDLVVTGEIPLLKKPIVEPIKETVTIPDETLNFKTPLGAGVTITEHGAMVEVDGELGPIKLFEDHIAFGGSKTVDIKLKGFSVKGTVSITA